MKLSRIDAFVASLAAAFVIPAAIPGMGLDYPYLFIMGIVLMAWFAIKWGTVAALGSRGSRLELAAGVGVVALDYAENVYARSELGLIDMIVIFAALAVAFYGVRALRTFWVPVAYGAVLLLGYQVENATPNFVALQDWMAGLMGSAMNSLGIAATVYGGHYVILNSGPSTLLLSVDSDCTGVQGVLAFGLLSTMTLIDAKPKLSRLVPVFIIGFGGAFLINILRLVLVFLTFEFLGVSAGTTMHLVAGYSLFIAWVFVFWAFAFKYLAVAPARPAPLAALPTPS